MVKIIEIKNQQSQFGLMFSSAVKLLNEFLVEMTAIVQTGQAIPLDDIVEEGVMRNCLEIPNIAHRKNLVQEFDLGLKDLR